jgi:predicted nucleic acid-binding protein
MKDKVFVDSNIWIYLFTSDDVSKNELVRDFIAGNTEKETIFVISYQVINEVGVVLKRKKKFSEDKIQFVVDTLLDLCVVQDFSREIIFKASVLRDKMLVSYWDSLIIAAAIESGCQSIASEDLQNGQKIEGLTIVNVFNRLH